MARTRSAMVRRIPQSIAAPRVTVVRVPSAAPARSRLAGVRRALATRAAGVTSKARLKRGAGLAVGGAASRLVTASLSVVATPPQAALITGGLGYLMADGSGSFADSVGAGMLAQAGGDWLYTAGAKALANMGNNAPGKPQP